MGIAHFCEHSIFKGTEKRDAHEINSCLDRLGGDLNAYTNKEEIVVHATVLKEDLPLAGELLLELASCPNFPEKEIEKEKGVVLDEIGIYKDSPYEDIYDRFETMIFEGHPLSRLILGTVASVEKINSAELSEFVKENFTPTAMTLSMVADIEEEKMEDLCRRLISEAFADAPDSEPQTGSKPKLADPGFIASLRRGAKKPRFFAPKVNVFDKVVRKGNHEADAICGSLAPSIYDDDRLAVSLLTNILGGPASNSILYENLREKNGWVYGVEASYNRYLDGGIFTVSMTCDVENVEKCFDEIRKEFRKIQEEPLSDEALAAAKKQMIGQMAISADNGENRCLNMGESLLCYGKVSSDEQTKAAILAITSDQIQSAARKVLDINRLSRMVYR
jgi:predicted Zn-dependent peptidase